jgi:methylmalonyl-CoA/ethylmalonyl-CoA epimerase
MVFHHIGLATSDIEKSKLAYKVLGYTGEDIIYDPNQRVNLCFLYKKDAPVLELVSPTEESSPVNNILQKNGTMPYHTCYEVVDLEQTISELKLLRYLVVVKPVEAIAFNNRRVCFLFQKHAGLIELLEA